MTTVRASNIHNFAVRGNFDDCQAMAKRRLLDPELSNHASLSTVNSINWGRIAAQIPYYFYAHLKLAGSESLSFAVPSGNFGNCFSGFAAHQMGLPVEKFIVGVNDNDGLRQAFEGGRVQSQETKATISPAMDIQVSSNFERLLLELSGRSVDKVRQSMNKFSDQEHYDLDPEWLYKARGRFQAYKVDEANILAEIKQVYERSGLMIDPHTAVGAAAARAWQKQGGQGDVICMATAHAAKFPEIIEQATGQRPELPPVLASLAGKEEFCTPIDASDENLQTEILRILSQ